MRMQQINPVSSAQQLQFLTFDLGSDAFGVDILKVREIRQWESVRSIPDAPEDVRGVLDLRGCIVPIVDLRKRLGGRDAAFSATTVVIIVMVDAPGPGDHLLGMVVDAVSDVMDVDPGDVRAAPDNMLGINSTVLAGMVSRDDGMVVLLNIDALFEGSLRDVRSAVNE